MALYRVIHKHYDGGEGGESTYIFRSDKTLDELSKDPQIDDKLCELLSIDFDSSEEELELTLESKNVNDLPELK